MEKRDSVAQKRRAVLNLLADRQDIFARQGSVQASWRHYQGQRLGPYYQLRYREGGRQRRVYLGADGEVAADVHRILAELQTPLRARRELAALEAVARAGLRRQKRHMARELAKLGLNMKGHEIRGWRAARGPRERGMNHDHRA